MFVNEKNPTMMGMGEGFWRRYKTHYEKDFRDKLFEHIFLMFSSMHFSLMRLSKSLLIVPIVCLGAPGNPCPEALDGIPCWRDWNREAKVSSRVSCEEGRGSPQHGAPHATPQRGDSERGCSADTRRCHLSRSSPRRAHLARRHV